MRNIVLKSSLPTESFNFMHLNPGSLRPHLSELQALVNGVNLHVIAVSETWFNSSLNNNLVSIPGFSIIRHDRVGKRGGGVAFYVREGIKYRIIRKSRAKSGSEFLFLSINNGAGVVFSVGVVYNPPGNKHLDPLKRVLERISSDFTDSIVLGDFNVNLLEDCPAVRRFKSFLGEAGWSCPLKSPTNFVPLKKPSLIDLLLIKNENSLKRYSHLVFGSFTSHDIIYGAYNISMASSDIAQTTFYRDIKRVDPRNLQEAAALLEWNSIYDMVEIDEQVEFVTSHIFSLMEDFAPLKQSRCTFQSKPEWMNVKLCRLIDARNACRMLMLKEKNPASKLQLLKSFHKIRNQVTTLKRSLQSRLLFKKFDSRLPPKTLWNNLREQGVVSKKQNFSDNFSSDQFSDYFSSVFSKSSSFVLNGGLVTDEDEFEFVNISEADVAAAIMAISTNATGEDEIPAIFIKKLCPFIVPFITHIVNCCLTKSYFPKLWKIANIIPISKVSSPTSIEDFRPISILPCLSKVLERVMKEQIQFFVSTNNLLFKYQSGFRSHHSTTTAMLKVVDEIARGFERNEATVLVLLDLRKAFDSVDHGKLIGKLRALFKFSSRACSLLQSYLNDRKQRVKLGQSLSALSNVTSGTPQGGILSSLLFSLFINDISLSIDCGIHLYADDTQLFCSGPAHDLSICVRKMNDSLEKIHGWAVSNMLQINPVKSQAIIFSRVEHHHPSDISIDGSKIPYCNSVKSLGLYLESKLSWEEHVSRMCSSVFAGLRMLNYSQNVTPRCTRLRLIKTLIIPKFLYCSNIYMGCSRESWRKINIAFNACARYIFGLKKFQSVSAFTKNILGCSIESYIHFRSCIFMHNLLKTQSPEYLFQLLNFPSHPRGGVLRLPDSYRSKQVEQSFFVQGVRHWNSLSSDLRSINSLSAFRCECLNYFALQRAQT